MKEFSEGIKGEYDVKFQKILNDPNTSEGTKTSMLESEDFKEATDYIISGELVNTHNAASILTNRAGKEYTFETLDTNKLPDVPKEGVIYLVPDPTNPNSGASEPLLTRKQNEEASEILRTAINSKIGVTETSSLKVKRDSIKLSNDINQLKVDWLNATKEDRVKLENLKVDKYNADLTAAKSAEEVRQIEIKYLEDEKDLGITKKEAEITAAKSLEEKRQVELKYLDENLMIDNDLLKKKLEASNKEESTLLKDYSSYVTNQYTITEADIADEDKAEENLVMAYGDIGFTFDTNKAFTDAILITSPDGETTTTILLDSPNAEQSIHNFINLNTPLLTINKLGQSGNLPKSKKKEGSNETTIDYSKI